MTSVATARFRLTRPLPALWRAPDVLQIGLDQGLLLEGVPTAAAEAIHLLERPRSPAELNDLLPQLGLNWIRWLLSRLQEAAFAVPDTPAPARQVAILGEGPLARAVIRVLDAAGLPVQRLRTIEQRPATDLRRLIILAGRMAEPDRAVTSSLVRAGEDHLVVRIEPDRAVVGPLVQPGSTPCVQCQDLAVARHDPAWPRLLAQLCRLRVEPDPVLLSWAAATTAAQLRAWAADAVPDALGASLEVELPGHRLHVRRWSAAGSCSCQGPAL